MFLCYIFKRYARSKVTIGTLVRYLATQSSQHELVLAFGVRQPAVSRRLDRAVRAVLSVHIFIYMNIYRKLFWFPKNEVAKIASAFHCRENRHYTGTNYMCLYIT